MPRVKRGVTAHARHKKVLKQAKGYYGARSKVFRVAKQAVIKAGQYAYRDRRAKKREFRALWIARINAGARDNGLSYSRSKSTARCWLIWRCSTSRRSPNWPTAPRPRSASPEASAGSEIPVRRPAGFRKGKGRGLSLFHWFP